MKKLLWLLPIAVVAFVFWAVQRKNDPPPVPFVKVKRETLVSMLSTNGKVEPSEWQAVRAESAGLVERVLVREGQTVAKGALLALMADPSLKAAIEAADARVVEARAALATIEAGGRTSDLAAIESSLARAKFAREEAQREHATLARLREKNAATAVEVAAAAAKVKEADLEIQSLGKRRETLIAAGERGVAQAHVRDAEAAARLARQKQTQSELRAPLAGTVYQLTVRPGAYLAAGDPVANIGRLDRVRVRVYVDEPELGRVVEGQPVAITWDALPGKEWSGTVESKPTSIQTLGTRQVGEVIATIGNPGRELIPGTNVNAAIRTAVVENAIVMPKEVLRRDGAGPFVFALRGGAVERRAVETGASSITKFQVTRGLGEGDAVAMPTDAALKAGDRVTPALQ